MRKNCKTFEQWVDSQYQEFERVCKKSSALQLHSGCRKNTRYTIIFNIKTKHSACETVNIKNGMGIRQSIQVSTALAWASYKGEDIPEFKKPIRIADIENGATFEDSEGIVYIKVGYNPRSNAYTCVNYYGANCYIEIKENEIVYSAS